MRVVELSWCVAGSSGTARSGLPYAWNIVGLQSGEMVYRRCCSAMRERPPSSSSRRSALVAFESLRYLTGFEPLRAAGANVVLDLKTSLIPGWQPFAAAPGAGPLRASRAGASAEPQAQDESSPRLFSTSNEGLAQPLRSLDVTAPGWVHRVSVLGRSLSGSSLRR